MDDADRVQALHERFEAAMRDARQRREHAGTEVCIDCGEAIPEARRRALPGAIRCLTCQGELEFTIR